MPRRLERMYYTTCGLTFRRTKGGPLLCTGIYGPTTRRYSGIHRYWYEKLWLRLKWWWLKEKRDGR